MVERHPYGSWASPISAELVAGKSVRLGAPLVDGEAIYWLEERPAERGRSVIVRWLPHEGARDILPPGYSARSRVHEYGGAPMTVHRGVVYFVNDADQRLYRLEAGRVEPITPEGRPYRYANCIVDERRQRLICVREDHTDPRPEGVVNTLVAVRLPFDPQGGRFPTGGDHLGGDLPPQRGTDPLQRRGGRGHVGLPAVDHQPEGDGGVGQGVAEHRLTDQLPFPHRRLEELATGGGVIKEVAHGDAGAHGAGRRFDRDLAALRVEAAPLQFVPGAGEDLQVGDGGDGGEGLPTEAQRADGLQVLQRADLAGGEPLQRQGEVGAGDTAAIVGDADEGEAAVADLHADGGGPGVQAVLDQFFDHRGGALDHLAGGDPLGDFGGKDLDSGLRDHRGGILPRGGLLDNAAPSPRMRLLTSP